MRKAEEKMETVGFRLSKNDIEAIKNESYRLSYEQKTKITFSDVVRMALEKTILKYEK